MTTGPGTLPRFAHAWRGFPIERREKRNSSFTELCQNSIGSVPGRHPARRRQTCRLETAGPGHPPTEGQKSMERPRVVGSSLGLSIPAHHARICRRLGSRLLNLVQGRFPQGIFPASATGPIRPSTRHLAPPQAQCPRFGGVFLLAAGECPKSAALCASARRASFSLLLTWPRSDGAFYSRQIRFTASRHRLRIPCALRAGTVFARVPFVEHPEPKASNDVGG